MSEEKIIDHTEKAIRAILNKERKWYEKVKDFVLEIIIIIIAVSLTLWFHNLNQRAHDRKQEKNFLISVRNDLENDAGVLAGKIDSSKSMIHYYNTVWKQIYTHRVDSAYVDRNCYYLTSTDYLIFDYSVFENFKSSGNLGLVENKKLLRHITVMYSEIMPFYEKGYNDFFDKRKQNFATYIGRREMIDSSGMIHVSRLLNDPAVRYQLWWDKEIFSERDNHFKSMGQEMDSVIVEINAELKSRF